MDIVLGTSKVSIPITNTAAALYVGAFQLPAGFYSMVPFAINRQPWEEQYVPRVLNYDYANMETIYRFAVTLLENSEDIPEEFAKVLNEDFWEII